MDDKQLKDIVNWYVTNVKDLMVKYCKGELALVNRNTGWSEVSGLDMFDEHCSSLMYVEYEKKEGGHISTDHRFTTSVTTTMKHTGNKIQVTSHDLLVCITCLDDNKQMLFDQQGNLLHSNTVTALTNNKYVDLFRNTSTSKYTYYHDHDDYESEDTGFSLFD